MAELATHSPLHEPYESYPRQLEATQLGMWVFLASELLLFSGLFLAYAVGRWTHGEAFDEAARHTNQLLGALNVGWLMTSSAAMTVAGRAVERGRLKLAVPCIWIAIALAFFFLVTKALEYREDLAEHLWPGPAFALSAPAAQTFFSLYWVMTGIHAIHVTIGIGLIGRLALMARAGVLGERTDSVEATSLYWHLVDAIWVVLFACLYVVGR